MKQVLLSVALAILTACCVLADTVNLAWDANTEEHLMGYRLYYGDRPEALGNPVDVGKVTQHSIEVPSGTYFGLTAVGDCDGVECESDLSNIVYYNTSSLLPATGLEVILQCAKPDYLLKEDGGYLLNENDGRLTK